MTKYIGRCSMAIIIGEENNLLKRIYFWHRLNSFQLQQEVNDLFFYSVRVTAANTRENVNFFKKISGLQEVHIRV